MENDIPLFKIFWDYDDIQAVNDVIKSGMNWAEGNKIKEFEKGIADYTGSKYCVSFNSGTSALHAVLIAHGIGKGDEVIVPSFTFIATANAPLFVGAKPVFADIERTTFGLNPDDTPHKITNRTKAIIPVHCWGASCDIFAIRELADEYNLILIEDAAESFGALAAGCSVGTFGDSGMFSFCQNKILSTGEGGAVVTDSLDIYEKLKLIRSHGRPDNINYFSNSEIPDHLSLGYNFRMSTMTAALGLSQLHKVDKIIKMRRELAEYYTTQLNTFVPEIIIPEIPGSHFSVYQLFSIFAPKRDELIKHLNKSGIASKIYFLPIHQTDYYKKTLGYTDYLPITEKISKSVVSLPFYPGMPIDDVDRVVQTIAEFYQSQRSC